jgi:AcrR family transcriptional regulator
MFSGMGLREQKKTDTRQRILDVCGQLYRNRGFDETTINDITAAAAVSRQTFFNYFSGKDAVLTELGLAWLRDQADVPKIGPPSTRAGSILAGTRNAIRTQLRAINADADFMRLVFTRSGLLFPQGVPADARSERVRTDHTRRLFDGLALVMRTAQQAGEVRSDIDPMQAAELYVSVMLMTIRFWLIDYWHDGVDLETRAMRALDVLEAGLTIPASS